MSDPITVPQKDAAWVRRSTPQEIHEALHRNELAVLLGGTAPIDVAATAAAQPAPDEPETSQLSREWVESATPQAITEARKAGRLNDLLYGSTSE